VLRDSPDWVTNQQRGMEIETGVGNVSKIRYPIAIFVDDP
jgi:hypothetical protein